MDGKLVESALQAGMRVPITIQAPMLGSKDLNGYCRGVHPECGKAVEIVSQWVADIKSGQEPWNLCLLGPSGVGKTHLARSACRLVGGAFRQWFRILGAIRDGHPGIPAQLEKERVLCIDDLGAGYDTDFSKALAAEMAERRVRKFTLWTSNLTPEALAGEFDTRLVSRLIRGKNQVFSFKECRDYSLGAGQA